MEERGLRGCGLRDWDCGMRILDINSNNMEAQVGGGWEKAREKGRFECFSQTEEGRKLLSAAGIARILQVASTKRLAHAYKDVQIVTVNHSEGARQNSGVPIKLRQQLAANRSLSDIRPASIRRETSYDSLRQQLNSQRPLLRSTSLQQTLKA